MRDREEFTRLVRQYVDTVYRVAYGALRSAAEDVTQNVLLKLWRTNKPFDGDAHIRHWLIRVTVNECKKAFLSPLRREVPIEDVAERLTFETPEHSALFYEVMALPKQYRVVLLLYYYEDYSTAEIDPEAWNFRQESQTDHFLCFHWEVDPNFYFSTKHWPGGYSAWATLDPDSGKITAFCIEAGNDLMHPDWEPIQTVTPEQQEAEWSAWDKCVRWLEANIFGIKRPATPPTLKWYNHYELLIDPAMTAGQFGQIWADYAGYDSFEVLGTDPDLPLRDDLSLWGSETYYAFQSAAGLHPVYRRLEFTSTAMSVVVSFSQITAADLTEDITQYGYQYGYLLRLCNRELAALYDLGLFETELQFTAEDYAPSNPCQSGYVSTNWKTRTKDDPSIHIQWNPATDQILYLSVTAPTPVVPETLTLGELCELWTAYDNSLDRYVLPDGAADTPVSLVDTLPDWHGDTDGWYYPIAFYEPGRDIPAMRYVSYIRLENGSMNFTFGTDYPKG